MLETFVFTEYEKTSQRLDFETFEIFELFRKKTKQQFLEMLVCCPESFYKEKHRNQRGWSAKTRP